MNVLFVILSLIIIILIFVLYNYTLTVNSLMKVANLHIRNSPVTITTTPYSNNYTMSCWFYLKNNAGIADGTKYYIFSRMGVFDFYIKSITGNMGVYADIKDSNNVNTNTYPLLASLPVQQWSYMTISVYNNIFDFYVNGKLINTMNIPAFNSKTVSTNSDTVVIGGSGSQSYQKHNSVLSNLIYSPKYSSPQEVYAAYMDVNKLSIMNILTTYTVDVELVKNGVVADKLTIL